MDELKPFVDKPGGTVVDLGSRDGQDAQRMDKIFNPRRVVTIEANPESFDKIVNDFPDYENYNLAITDHSGEVPFWKVSSEHGEVMVGQSSLLYKTSYDEIATQIVVPCMTMDNFVESSGIDEIEALKIDVEGATLNVLRGFSKIRMTRLLHIESEHEVFWSGQHLYEDTEAFMIDAGYELVYFKDVWTNQSDTIWRRID